MNGYDARDRAVTAAIFGLAAAAWFGWAQESPPAGWSIPLEVGSLASLVIMVGGGFLVIRHRHGPTAMADPRVRRLYHLTVAVEGVACLVGAIGLGRSGHQAYISAWVLFVVGAHFLPLARLFGRRDLLLSGLVLIIVSGVAVAVGTVRVALPTTVAGAGAGLVLATCAVLDLHRAYVTRVDTAVTGSHAG
jgi:hypothetical protein